MATSSAQLDAHVSPHRKEFVLSEAGSCFQWGVLLEFSQSSVIKAMAGALPGTMSATALGSTVPSVVWGKNRGCPPMVRVNEYGRPDPSGWMTASKRRMASFSTLLD